MDYPTLLARANDWRDRLNKVKRENPPDGFTWYGYDILANLEHIQPLLDGELSNLFDRVARQPMADIGAADGDLGLLFASLGWQVDLLDHPDTNWNGMRGVRKLSALLDLPAGVHQVDLDAQFTLPRERYGLILLLGILYHLKNPYFTLEKLARHTRFCLISTRIAKYVGAPELNVSNVPLAYLLAPDESNNDATNYWIFSQAGLRRIVERAGFRIVAMRTVGDLKHSNPSAQDRDERAFLLLESNRSNW
jgi:tRNA (mo5U34)-methyltransferase